MRKIASPQELQTELRRLLAYCSGPEKPSREKLAAELRELASRVKCSEGQEEKLVALFDSLRPGQKISVAMTSVMGTSEATSGKPQDWIVGRRSKGRNYETITLLPVDASWKPTKYNAFKLWKRENYQGEVTINASQGDMGLFLKSINGVSAK